MPVRLRPKPDCPCETALWRVCWGKNKTKQNETKQNSNGFEGVHAKIEEFDVYMEE